MDSGNGTWEVSKEKIFTHFDIVKYEISKDKVGLLAYFSDGSFYHIHSNELTRLELWILGLLQK